MQTQPFFSTPARDLRPREQPILQALHRYYCLTSRQICRLLYSRGSLTYIQATLKALVDQRYVQRIWIPKRGPFGSSPAVYMLARRGLNHLRNLGMTLERRHHPAEQDCLSYLFLSHTMS